MSRLSSSLAERARPLCAWLATAIVASGLASAASAQDSTFEEFARQARERYGLEGIPRAPESFELLLDTRCHRLRLGFFELLIPADAARETKEVKLLSSVARDLLGLQQHWAEWTGEEDSEQLVADLETLSKWCKKWSASALKKATPGGDADLTETLDARPEVREAAQRARAALLGRGAAEPLAPARLILAPARGTFVTLAALAGWCDDYERETLWQEHTLATTSVWIGDTQLVAFEYPELPFDARRPDAGQSMNLLLENGVRQHTVDRGAASLLHCVFNRYADPMVEIPLATNLVIATVGENDLDFDIGSIRWSRKGARTEAYTRFIPAGSSFGEALKPRRAQAGPTVWHLDYKPSWRVTAGKDYFARPLHSGQKGGAKAVARDRERTDDERKNKLAHFPLKSAESGESYVVSAPFLGSWAEGGTAPPVEFLDDYEEFFRAYQASFFEWLRTEGVDGDAQDSRVRFQQLLRRFTDQKQAQDLDQAVLEVYGVALSAPRAMESAQGDSLEWRFLRWLSKRR